MVDPALYARTVYALEEIPSIVGYLQSELTEATPTLNGHTKPSSRPPAPVGLLADLDTGWAVVTSWAVDWSDRYQYTPPRVTWADVCGFLARHWPNASITHPAAAEFADEIAGIAGRTKDGEPVPLWGAQRTGSADGRVFSVLVSLSRYLDDREHAWRPITGRWKCPVVVDAGPCGGKLLEHVEQRFIVCTRTGTHSWQADEYERLGLMLGQEYLVTIGQAAAVAKVSRRTVERWAKAEMLPVTLGPDGHRLIDKRDLAILVTRGDR